MNATENYSRVIIAVGLSTLKLSAVAIPLVNYHQRIIVYCVLDVVFYTTVLLISILIILPIIPTDHGREWTLKKVEHILIIINLIGDSKLSKLKKKYWVCIVF